MLYSISTASELLEAEEEVNMNREEESIKPKTFSTCWT